VHLRLQGKRQSGPGPAHWLGAVLREWETLATYTVDLSLLVPSMGLPSLRATRQVPLAAHAHPPLHSQWVRVEVGARSECES